MLLVNPHQVHWFPRKRTMISSPPGSGKTSFGEPSQAGTRWVRQKWCGNPRKFVASPWKSRQSEGWNPNICNFRLEKDHSEPIFEDSMCFFWWEGFPGLMIVKILLFYQLRKVILWTPDLQVALVGASWKQIQLQMELGKYLYSDQPPPEISLEFLRYRTIEPHCYGITRF